MFPISRRSLLLALPVLSRADSGWIPLFDGRTLNGWKSNEKPGSFHVEGGQIVAAGPRSHLFYTRRDFKNFELKAEVMTRPEANSGIFFHTAYQESGWPAQGFEVQIANTHIGEGNYRERKKTGSLYGVRNVYKQLVKDDVWFQMHILVRGKQVQIRLNDMLVVDYVEPDPPVRVVNERGRVLGHGTFALQGHDPKSKTFFRNILVKPLPDNAPPVQSPVVDDIYRGLLEMSAHNFPVVDYHVHLKGGLTLEEALRESRRLGIGYGIAVNGGLDLPTHNDATAGEYLRTMQGQPCFVGMQAEGREWVKIFSRETVAKFDYVFTDSMTFSDDNGKRMRTWIKDEIGVIPDKQKFMEMLVNRIEGILNHEPIDIYANSTYLPDQIAAEYDELWTPVRMQRVIEALKKNDVAMEINARRSIPSPTFIKAAKKAGVTFSFGTNNAERELGRIEYCVRMVKECGLTWQDIFVPKPDGEKPVQRRGFTS